MAWLLCMLFSVLCFLLPLTERGKRYISNDAQKVIIIFPFIYWILLLGGQYQVGTDYGSYYDIFENGNYGLYYRKKEFGFFYIAKIIFENHLHPQIGFFIISFIQCFAFVIFISKYDFKRIDLFLLVYFCCCPSFINQTNTLRQYMSMYIFLIAVLYMYEKKYVKFLILLIIAQLFHTSALFCLIFLPISKLCKSKSKKLLKYCLLLSCVIMILGLDFFLSMVIRYTPYAYYIGDAFASTGIGLLNKMTRLVYLPFYFLVIKGIDIWTERDKWFIKFGIYSYCINIVSLSSPLLHRFGIYVEVFAYLPVYYYIYNLVNNHTKKEYVKIFWLFISLCIILGPYLLKIIVFPVGEYKYNSIFFN